MAVLNLVFAELVVNGAREAAHDLKEKMDKAQEVSVSRIVEEVVIERIR